MIDELIAYADVGAHRAVRTASAALAAPDDALAARDLARTAFALDGCVIGAIATAVLASEGPFARAARAGLAPQDRRLRRAASELDALGALAHADLEGVLRPHGLGDALPRGRAAPAAAPPVFRALWEALVAAPGWGRSVARVAAMHRDGGTGALARHRVLRYAGGVLCGVARPDPLTLEDLTGGDDARAPLLEDLAAFAAGGTANDALLYGPPGTGKSAAVRALAARFAAEGLRLVQVGREDVARLADLFAALAGEGPRCLVALDDLVFDGDDDRADRALRAALEGDVAARPANVLVWATSNRLRIVRETRSQREDDLEEALARGERSALATRFGRRVRFGALDVDAYVAVAERLVRERLGHVPPGTAEAAVRFSRGGHGLTPRTARQYAATVRPA